MFTDLNTNLTLPVPPAPEKGKIAVYNGHKWEQVKSEPSRPTGNFQVVGNMVRVLFPVDENQPVVRT